MFTEWQNWNECSLFCGSGEQIRYRKCDNGNIGSPGCEKELSENERICNTEPCRKIIRHYSILPFTLI